LSASEGKCRWLLLGWAAKEGCKCKCNGLGWTRSGWNGEDGERWEWEERNDKSGGGEGRGINKAGEAVRLIVTKVLDKKRELKTFNLSKYDKHPSQNLFSVKLSQSKV
jgi:hypothetical protein